MRPPQAERDAFVSQHQARCKSTDQICNHWPHPLSLIMQQGPGGSEDDYIPVSDLANSSMQQHEVEEVEAFWDANPQLGKLSTWEVSMPCWQPL